jgi:alkylation response protein AidB-like acyl-CoA dehydrogenase
MDFAWSEKELAYRQKVIEFADLELNKDMLERDRGSVFRRDLWQRCADFGIQAMSVPALYTAATQDTGFLTAMLAMEALGYACKDNGLTFALNAQMWTVQLPIVHFGSEEQKQKYLPGFCDGSLIGAHAITEAGSGSDTYSMQTVAEKQPGGYLLNGRKTMITCGPLANVALVFATIDPGLGKWGVTAFLVERETAGFDCGPEKEKMGLRTAPLCDLLFENCFVPEANRLGPEGSGVSLSTSFLEWERCCILASQLGAMERQLEECIKFAKKREQFGQAIGKFQSVANRVVEMRLRLETSRLLLYKVAWLKQTEQPAMLEAALLKLHLSECFLHSSLDAIRIHGGRGYLSEYEIERELRDAVGGTIYAGTSDIQRNIVAGLLGL